MSPQRSTSSRCAPHWRASGPSTQTCGCPTSCDGSAPPSRLRCPTPSSLQGKGTLMSVLDPRELQASPLADLHALAAELGLEGFRRLRKEQLLEQIVIAQGGEMPPAEESDDDADPETELYEDAAAEPEQTDN